MCIDPRNELPRRRLNDAQKLLNLIRHADRLVSRWAGLDEPINYADPAIVALRIAVTPQPMRLEQIETAEHLV